MPVFCQGGVRLKSGLHHFIIETLKSYLLIEKIGWMSWPVNRRNSLPCSVMTSRQRLFNQGWIVCYVLKIISYSWPRVLYPLRVDDDLGYSRWLLDTSKKELWNNLFFHDLNTNTDMKLQIKFLMEANIYECHYKAVAYLKS